MIAIDLCVVSCREVAPVEVHRGDLLAAAGLLGHAEDRREKDPGLAGEVLDEVVGQGMGDAVDVGRAAGVLAAQDQLAGLQVPDARLDGDPVARDVGPGVDEDLRAGAEPPVGGVGGVGSR